MTFLTTAYGPVLGELLSVDRNRALDAGSPERSKRERLQSLTVAKAFAHARILDADQAQCCLAGLWLLCDFLDESHTLSQGIASAEGSFWHAIMHRREGDFSNSKYWFRKVGHHPVFERIEPDWDPFDFVDACQSATGQDGAEEDRCRQLQQREWELLFDYCYREAVGE